LILRSDDFAPLKELAVAKIPPRPAERPFFAGEPRGAAPSWDELSQQYLSTTSRPYGARASPCLPPNPSSSLTDSQAAAAAIALYAVGLMLKEPWRQPGGRGGGDTTPCPHCSRPIFASTRCPATICIPGCCWLGSGCLPPSLVGCCGPGPGL